MLRNCRVLVTALLGFLAGTFTVFAHAAEDVDPIFADKSILKVSLSAPIETIMEERSLTTERPGRFGLIGADGEIAEFDIAVRSRGNYRRRTDVCDFAPLRVNFKKSQTKDTLLHKQDKVKIVTHCKDNSDRYQQTMITEYLAYEILNLFTDLSYQARLLQISYTDTENPKWEMESYGVLLEHKDRLAKRIDQPELEITNVLVDDLNAEHMNLGSLFEYLIGNSDFSPIQGAPGENCCHNFVLFGTLFADLYSIPYDFDQTGIVRAPHAGANPSLGIRFVTQRVYRGRCANNELLPATIGRFQEQKDNIFMLINNQVELDNKNRKRVVKYIEDFYKVIDNPKAVQKQLVKKCI
jgi:hypothetical protein